MESVAKINWADQMDAEDQSTLANFDARITNSDCNADEAPDQHKRKQVLCTYFVRGCTRGNECLYAHVSDPCIKYGIQGYCQSGAECMKQHVEFPLCRSDECSNRTRFQYCEGCIKKYNESKQPLTGTNSFAKTVAAPRNHHPCRR
jgi:hypothetical protein